MNINLRKVLIIWALLAFLANMFGPVPLAQAQFRLPAPGVMIHLSPRLDPPILKGIKVHPENPFRFDFILDPGDSLSSFGVIARSAVQRSEATKQSLQEQLKIESTRLIKYFLASLTIPEKDLWVNLSPYEKDRIIPNSFGLTEMGRDLLAEDYMLKQITASLIYPEDEIGKKFWKRIYEEAAKKFGTTNIPVNTFNKVWIVPEKAVVYENAMAGTAYVVESKLKVMLEQDYLALSHSIIPAKAGIHNKNNINALGSQIVREIVIPELSKEVNEGKNFGELRQVYNSLILATWYKKKIKDSILEQVYADKNKVAGINIDDPKEKEKIYQQYLKAFKKGVYNYIKEDVDPATQEKIPRKYFSGGLNFATDVTGAQGIAELLKETSNPAMIRRLPDHAMAAVQADIRPQDQAMSGMGLFLFQGLRQNLSLSQKQGLHQLTLLAQELMVPIPPNVITGRPGLEAADKILKEHNAIGIVIGSMSASLHNRLANEERLKKHSDVDVVVLSPDFELSEPFEGGVDWWVSKTLTLDVITDLGINENVRETIFVNGNDIYLPVGIDKYSFSHHLEPGLYLPDRDFLIGLTENVVLSRVDVAVDEEVLEAFRKRLEKQIGESISPVWQKNFGKDRILSGLSSVSLDADFLTAVRKSTPYHDVGDREGEASEIIRSQGSSSTPVVPQKKGDNDQLGRDQAMIALKYEATRANETALMEREWHEYGLKTEPELISSEGKLPKVIIQIVGVDQKVILEQDGRIYIGQEEIPILERERIPENRKALKILLSIYYGGAVWDYYWPKLRAWVKPFVHNFGLFLLNDHHVNVRLSRGEYYSPEGSDVPPYVPSIDSHLPYQYSSARNPPDPREPLAKLFDGMEIFKKSNIGPAGFLPVPHKKKENRDNAMRGGIDLTPANMDLQTQNSGGNIKFQIDPAMFHQLQNAPGFTISSITIQPLKSLPDFLGINNQPQSQVNPV